MESKRQQKFARLIQKELAEILQRDTRSLLDGAFVTITKVRMSPDLGHAKVYMSMMLAKDKNEVLSKIKAGKSQLRNLLGARIKNQVRVIPDMDFYIDDNLEYAAKMDEIFSKIDIPPAEDEESNEENKS